MKQLLETQIAGALDRLEQFQAGRALNSIRSADFSAPQDKLDKHVLTVIAYLPKAPEAVRQQMEEVLDIQYNHYGLAGRQAVAATIIEPLEQLTQDTDVETRDRLAFRATGILAKMDTSIQRRERVFRGNQPDVRDNMLETIRAVYEFDISARQHLEDILYSNVGRFGEKGKQHIFSRLLSQNTNYNESQNDRIAAVISDSYDVLPERLQETCKQSLFKHLRRMSTSGKTTAAEILMRGDDDRAARVQEALQLFEVQKDVDISDPAHTAAYAALPYSLQSIQTEWAVLEADVLPVLNAYSAHATQLTQQSREKLNSLLFRHLGVLSGQNRMQAVNRLVESGDVRGEQLRALVSRINILMQALPPEVYQRYAGRWEYEVLIEALNIHESGDTFEINYEPSQTLETTRNEPYIVSYGDYIQADNFTQWDPNIPVYADNEVPDSVDLPERLILRRVSKSSG